MNGSYYAGYTHTSIQTTQNGHRIRSCKHAEQTTDGVSLDAQRDRLRARKTHAIKLIGIKQMGISSNTLGDKRKLHRCCGAAGSEHADRRQAGSPLSVAAR